MRRLHPAKCLCPHGYPWYACTHFECEPRDDVRYSVTIGSQVHTWYYSNWESFLRAHPDAAEALTR